jgi:hypothetical protein
MSYTCPSFFRPTPELMQLRSQGHRVFDGLWMSGAMNRLEAYRILAGALGINVGDCHFRFFTAEQCRLAIEFCRTVGLPRTYQKARPRRDRRGRVGRRLAISRMRLREAEEAA